MENKKENVGKWKSSPTQKKGKISYLLPHPLPQELIFLGKTKDAVLRFVYKGFKTPNKISKETKFARTTIKQHLEELEKMDLVFFEKDENGKKKYAYPYEISEKGIALIEKSVGFPVDSIHNRHLRQEDLKTYRIRGHAFIWLVRPNKKFNWMELLNKAKIKWIPKGFGKTPRIIFNGKKIWLGKRNITLWLPKNESFFAKNSYQAYRDSANELILDMESLMEKLGIEFQYRFTCSRNEYGNVNSALANHFIDKKNDKKIYVKNEKGYWWKIDYSQGKFKEDETIHPADAREDRTWLDKFMNSVERTKGKVNPEFTLELINKVTQNQMMFAQNIEKHMDILDEMGKTLKRIQENLTPPKKAKIKNMKNLKKQ